MIAQLHVDRQGDVAVLTIDNPPINVGSVEIRSGLLAAIEALRTDDGLHAAVIIGSGRTFVAGSDLREFGQPLEDPQLPAVIAAMERCGKPVVAALHGAALGGGFELALGCDARIALPGTLVGLPEVTLGIIPGAGGTQRLPRLVGVPRAIGLICSGERVDAAEALSLGMVDEIADGNLLGAAVDLARRLDGRKNLVRQRALLPSEESEVEGAARRALKAGRGRPAVRAAIEAVKGAAILSFDEGLERERASFQELRVSREARALRHLFFAERASARHRELADVVRRSVERVGVIGAGTMGTGIAIAALDAGFGVVLIERDAKALERGRSRIGDLYAGRVARGKLDGSVAAERQNRLAIDTDWSPLGEVDLAVEAVFEDIEVKKAVFARLDAVMRDGAVLASNTSYLDLDAIAAATGRPRDVIGLHFFSPANVMRLLEVVRGAKTAPDTLATGLAFAKRLRKLPIVTANAFGFIGNRIYSAYRRQCEYMIEEGAYPEDVDAALEAFGFAMGPFAVADMSGLDIAWRMRKAQAATRDPVVRYVDIPDMLCEAGRLGRKTGAGYYRYPDGGRERRVDPAVHAMIDEARARKDIVARTLEEAEIQRRAMLAIVNEAALLMGEGVAARASDIDLVLTNGYGFPPGKAGRPSTPASEGARLSRRISTGLRGQAAPISSAAT